MKFWVIVAAAVAALAFVVVFGRRGRTPDAPAPSVVAPAVPVSGLPVASGGLPDAALAPAAPAPSSTALAVRQVAMTFAERYGSYSNEGNFTNIEDLYPLMTARFRRDREAFVAAQRAQPLRTTPSVTTTIVLRADAVLPAGEESTTASVTVTTQRTAAVGSGAPTVTAQDLVLAFVKDGEQWLVDRAEWRE